MNHEELVVFGHVFKSWSPDSYRVDRRGIRHAISIIRMFTISPMSNATITLQFKGMEVKTKTLDDGYFRFNIPIEFSVNSGWHDYNVICEVDNFGIIETAELLKPFESKYGIISDIDDTFLVSHSNNFFLKLYVLLTKNLDNRNLLSPMFQYVLRLP